MVGLIMLGVEVCSLCYWSEITFYKESEVGGIIINNFQGTCTLRYAYRMESKVDPLQAKCALFGIAC